MNYYLIAPAKTFRQDEGQLSYESADALKIGQLVEVPLGKQSVIGIVTKKIDKPAFPTKAVSRVLYDQPLPKHLVKSILWLSEYYRCPLASVVQAALPRGITKNRRATKLAADNSLYDSSLKNPLNAAPKGKRPEDV